MVLTVLTVLCGYTVSLPVSSPVSVIRLRVLVPWCAELWSVMPSLTPLLELRPAQLCGLSGLRTANTETATVPCSLSQVSNCPSLTSKPK